MNNKIFPDFLEICGTDSYSFYLTNIQQQYKLIFHANNGYQMH